MKYLILITTFIALLSGGEKIMEGKPAPDFTLKDQDGIEHTLSDYKGKNVVVYFYPKDDTPGCTKEACSIRDNFDVFGKLNIEVFGVSYDDAKSHRKFKDKYNLPFTLLSDSDKEVSKAYDTYGMLYPSRHTFVINKEGIVIKVFKEVDVAQHANEIIAVFDKK